MSSFIDQEIERLKEIYLERTPNSRRVFEQANASLPAGNTRNNLFFPPYPPYFERGEGCRLIDVDGNSYLDFLSDFTVAIYGHSHPRLQQETREVLERGCSYGGCIPAEHRLADAIKARFTGIEQLRFTNSGTEANLYALLTVLAHSGKSKVIVFEGNYHGGVMNYCHPNIPINAPFETIVLPYNDAEAFEQTMSAHGQEVGAVILELMINSGGCIPATEEFAAKVRQLTRQAGIAMIVDEVMTARLGYHGLQGKYGIEADMTTLGKIIGGGFSIGAFGGKREYMEIYDAQRPGYTAHGGSFNNNVFSMHAGAVALTEILTAEVMDSLNQRGDLLRAQLNKIFEEAEVPLLFTGGGSVMNLQLTRTPLLQKNRNPLSAEVAKLYHRFLLDRGIWLAVRGMIALNIAMDAEAYQALLHATSAFANHYQKQLQALA
ncbi:aminotransferase class III-fold pyridoxal phosphate-dependent enzyme [Pseudomaricurvus alkylphenolicus]|uniref:aspartate aminotransferase family protein n=1 Tax=Pseudomaricurvus alkylphenolicus TaxID=1306991 RepID=UPI00141F7297|nr:aminotransferase class III-fold pyridoxal phosphate-dependent enzyme [Pseudomaricurvus alkylphenolicus]NIB42478.1 aminotransferase class III-fold pyridoxal phosphate-dependent enzyme [Pseudomaricurvus alkylphenolicus]